MSGQKVAMSNPTAAMLVIGDEILSGRTRDANMYYLAGRLATRGIQLKEMRVVSDDHTAIVDAVRALSGACDIVFTSGGIGPTHDDITADAVAAAFERPIDVRADARAVLEEHYTKTAFQLNEARLRMARIPNGATLINNQISGAPGFILENVHVCAGVPKIFEAMVEAVLPGLATGRPVRTRTVRVERPEGEVAGPLGAIAKSFSDLSIGSYPFNDGAVFGTNIVVLGVDIGIVTAAESAIKKALL